MDYLARKISRAKWDPTLYTELNDIRADAITGPCLRTYGDALSLWRCHHDKMDVAEVVLALASAPDMEKLDPIDIVLIYEGFLPANHLQFEATPQNAKTLVEDLRARHVDVINLTMTKIVKLATEMARNVRNNSTFYRFTKSQVRDLLLFALKSGRLNLNDLKEKFQQELKSR